MTIAIEYLVVAALLFGLICIGLGYWWATASQKRATGGKSIRELAQEKQDYQDQVVEHFKTTAELLNEMTDKYRDVYRHMAEGAQSLAASESASPALAALQRGLLTPPDRVDGSADIVPTVTEQETQNDETASKTEVQPSDDSEADKTSQESALVSEGVDSPAQSSQLNEVQTGDAENSPTTQANDESEFFSDTREPGLEKAATAENDTDNNNEAARRPSV